MKNRQQIIIIGGGVAGLSTGIYAQKCGFDSIVLERHVIAGGQCTGWERQGFHIDNCVHWMTGTSPYKQLNAVWREVGALGDEVPIVQHDSFMRIDGKEGSFQIWTDLQRMQREMIAIAPEDEKMIRKFVDAIERYKVVDMPADVPPEERGLLYILKTLWKMRKVGRVHRQMMQISIAELAAQFRNPLIRQSMLCYLPDTFFAEALLYMYATFVCGNGALPKGGSLAMARRMQQRYESLGGKVKTGAEVVQIVCEGRHAKGVRLKDGTMLEADFVVAACDPAVTFGRLLDKPYQDDFFTQRYREEDNYPVFSHAEIFYGSDVRLADDELASTVTFESERPIMMVGREHRTLLVKHYQYEEDFAPEGKMVLQVMILQNGSDFDQWKQLRESDLAAYKAEKNRISEEVQHALEEHFPRLAGHLKVVEMVTPHSFHRFCGSYRGGYMPFVIRPGVKRVDHNGRIPNLDNGYLAGQWLQQPGGLPNAVVTGKFAIQRLCKDHAIPFLS